jgi:3-hydroxyacyl-CoA dehydrogenase
MQWARARQCSAAWRFSRNHLNQPMSEAVNLTWRDGDIAVLTVDNPPVNAINVAVRQGLLAAITDLGQQSKVSAIIIAAAGRTFMAGSDIREFDAPPVAPLLPDVIAAIDACGKPVVAALHGTALGGGFEVALGCHYRVAAANARVGLPEINLGLIPGAGGTQRLPRLIGVPAALDWIISGRLISATEALSAGAIDEIAQDDVIAAAVAAARRLMASGMARRTGLLTVFGEHTASFIADQEKTIAKRARGFEAPVAALEAIASCLKPLHEGVAVEATISRRLKASDQSRAQRHLFFGEREVARIPDIPADTPLRPLAAVGVVGAGTMGRGIAVVCLNAGLRVQWVDQTEELLGHGLAAVSAIYARDVEKKRISAEVISERLSRLQTSSAMTSLADVDLVIEAAFENMDVKTALFANFDRICKAGAILATNTSTLDVNHIAAATTRPQDVVGLHFFSPAHVMKLLEVVRGAKSAPDAVATAMAFGKRIGKVAVLSGVCFGFIGNRMFEGYIRESQRLLLEGATPAQVDRALTNFGMAMGPCAVIDLAGVDVSFLTREGNRANLPPDPTYCAIGDKLHHLGRFGQKTGQGFYRYASGRAEPDPEVDAIIRTEAKRLGVSARTHTDSEIVMRCLAPLVDEGCRILDEKIAARPVDIDVVWTSGYGFPRYRGGPMFHADLVGLPSIAAAMASFAEMLGNDFGYWTPSPLLSTLAAQGKTLAHWSAP